MEPVTVDSSRKVSPLLPPPRIGWEGDPAHEPGFFEEMDSYDSGTSEKKLKTPKPSKS
jgi:hypothetical protein